MKDSNMEKLTGYELSRKWFDWTFENPDKVQPLHTALYMYIIEHCNRLGWKDKFGLPTEMTKDAIGIKSYHTYIKALNDLIDFGFIILIEKSKNQYSSNIVALANYDKALDKALDKAIIKAESKHMSKQVQSTCQSTCQSTNSINKLITDNLELITKNFDEFEKFILSLSNEEGKQKKFDFKKSLISLGIKESIVKDFMIVRKNKDATNTETAFNAIKKQIELSGLTPNECITIAVEHSWKGFKADWLSNITSNEKPSAYKKKEDQEKPSVAPAEDYHRFIDLIRSNPILNESRNMLLEFEYNNLKMSFDEIVSLLPKIASMERRRGLYLELIDERDRIAYYKNKLNK
jgi:hypothetical protein